MSSAGDATSCRRVVVCGACKQTFKRLSTHLSHSAACNMQYMTSHGDPQQDPIEDARLISVAALPNADATPLSSSTYNKQQHSSNRNTKHVDADYTKAAVGAEFTLPLPRMRIPVIPARRQPDDTYPILSSAGKAPGNMSFQKDHSHSLDEESSDDGDIAFDEEVDSESTGTEEPDTSVLKLYDLLATLRSNPLDLARFSQEEKVHISLLQLLKEINAPLTAFTRILKWAAKSSEDGHQFKSYSIPTREKVIQNLFVRYNMKGLTPKESFMYLPYSKRIVSMVYFDAREVFASLLSCPTINKDENFLFHGREGGPFAEPSRSSILGDIDTGLCYKKTYEALVKIKGVDMILPCVLAMDKTHIDSGGRMQMEPITISNGLLNHAVRSQPSAMRILGYINHSTPAHKPEQSTDTDAYSDAQFNNIEHLSPDVFVAHGPLKPRPPITWPTYLLNEMHLQIRFILEASGFIALQRNGFRWMLHYMGKPYPVVLHPFVPFIVGDTEGHDRLCGHYTARFAKVKQLCRACECPTEKTGYSQAKYPHRKPSTIDRLVECGKLNQLKSMSQSYLRNGFARVRFGMHNKRGIFGACPGEMLHLISLGWFKYCLAAFAGQAGKPGTIPVKKYDSLCATIGLRLSRQSDRNVPRTNFPKGFSSGTNLMGHEFTGCLLVKLFALHTTSFTHIFPKRKGDDPNLKQLRNPNHVTDWILVVSSLLQWHQWMKQSHISKSQVSKSQLAVQWLMRRVAEVSPRPKGMGTNTIKTHLVLHLREDMLDHGVPQNVNSAYAESAHIPLAKETARKTQRRASSFTKQAAQRYVENLAISLASSDMVSDVERILNVTSQPVPPAVASLSGRGFFITSSPDDDSVPIFCWNRRMPNDDIKKDVLEPYVMAHLMQNLVPCMPNRRLNCFTELKSAKGDTYRAHPNIYDGRPWNDHAMVDWHEITHPLPAYIHTFIDLHDLPKRGIISVNNQKYSPGMYAVVHSFSAIDVDAIEVPNTMIGKYTVDRDEHSQLPTLYIIPIASLVSPTIGIQDVGCSNAVNKLHLFLIRRLADWPASWDAIITDVHQDSKKRAPSPEKVYEDTTPPAEVPTVTQPAPAHSLANRSAGAKPSRKRKKQK